MKKSNTELSFTSDVAQIRKYSLIPTTQFNLISSLSMKRKRRNSCKNLNIIPSQSEIAMKNTIKSISKQIIIQQSKNNNGSLYSLFSSSLFNINMLLFYLDTKNDCGIISTLVNMLYREDYKKEAYFYLPQIIAIYLNKKILDLKFPKSTKPLWVLIICNIILIVKIISSNYIICY